MNEAGIRNGGAVPHHATRWRGHPFSGLWTKKTKKWHELC